MKGMNKATKQASGSRDKNLKQMATSQRFPNFLIKMK
jgi:hypothetical protein